MAQDQAQYHSYMTAGSRPPDILTPDLVSATNSHGLGKPGVIFSKS
jgi:hypothetical protein